MESIQDFLAQNHLVGTGNEHHLSGGIYIVVTDSTIHKVVVR